MLDAIQHLLGDYSTVTPVELICRGDRAKNAEAASPVLAKLKGKRMVTMSESDTAGKLDESVIKQLTGGEEMSCIRQQLPSSRSLQCGCLVMTYLL